MCKVCGEWHDLEEPWPEQCIRHTRVHAIGVISDTIPDMVHPANGKMYDSKSTFRKVTRAYGYEEVGTEKQVDRRQAVHQDFSKDVIEAVRKINEGYRPSHDRGGYNGDGWQ